MSRGRRGSVGYVWSDLRAEEERMLAFVSVLGSEGEGALRLRSLWRETCCIRGV